MQVIQADSIIAKMQIYVFELCQIVNSLMQIESMHLEVIKKILSHLLSDIVLTSDFLISVLLATCRILNTIAVEKFQMSLGRLPGL